MDAAARTLLQQGVQGLGFGGEIAAPLERFGDTLARWNQTYNLVADCSQEQLLTRHLLDALAALAALRARPELAGGPGGPGGEVRRVADCGSGPGLPGCIWAIAMPGWEVECLDSQYRPLAFLRAFRAEEGLPNLHIRRERVGPGSDSLAGGYDLVVERAFLPPRPAVEAAGHLLRPGGLFAVLSSWAALQEVAAWPRGFAETWRGRLRVPGGPQGRALALLQRGGA